MKRSKLTESQIVAMLNEGQAGTVAKNYSEFQKGYFLVLATLELSS